MKIEDHRIRVYFRIPFTMYFLCREIYFFERSKFYICTRRFDDHYYWNVMK